ncbi:MAG TPA: hypothetical protein DCP71_02265 [Verrucomicrobiales bacterium]|nr:hypothetical protein [Verrucomicrobiales bacterium]
MSPHPALVLAAAHIVAHRAQRPGFRARVCPGQGLIQVKFTHGHTSTRGHFKTHFAAVPFGALLPALFRLGCHPGTQADVDQPSRGRARVALPLGLRPRALQLFEDLLYVGLILQFAPIGTVHRQHLVQRGHIRGQLRTPHRHGLLAHQSQHHRGQDTQHRDDHHQLHHRKALATPMVGALAEKREGEHGIHIDYGK